MLEFGLAFGWLFIVVSASAFYRRFVGKLIVPKPAPTSTFIDRWSSGRSLRNALTRIGGARNCLLIYVADGDLVVAPQFPFTLGFLPEVYGLDLRISLSRISRIDQRGRRIRLEFVADEPAAIELEPRRLGAFLQAIGRSDLAGTLEPERTKGRFRQVFIRLFLLVWGSIAIFAGVSGVLEDRPFQRRGVETVGIVTGQNGEPGSKGDVAVVSYKANGTTHQLISWRGNGLFEMGDHIGLRYLPDDPSQGREIDLFYFDLFWVAIGIVVLTFATAWGAIKRSFMSRFS